MLRLIRDEFRDLGLFLKRNADIAVVIGAAMLFMTLNRYQPLTYVWQNDFVYYALLPVLTVLLLLHKHPLKLGLGWGDWRTWSRDVALVCAVSVFVLLAASRSASFQQYYAIKDFNPLMYSLETFVVLFAQEFFFRGFLIFGLKDKLKEAAIFVQVIPFVLVHFGKPELETLSTILTGILFGYIAYRGRSFWPAYIIHIFINLFFVLYINLALHPALS
jgi:uncharacterized protein